VGHDESLYRSLVENAREYAIFLVDTEGRVASWNRGAERILGFRDEEIVGQSAAILFTPEDRQGGVPERELNDAAATGRAEDRRWYVRRDGTRFWTNGVLEPVRGENGRVLAFVKILRDETERKLGEEERARFLIREQRAREQAEEASRAKDALLATVSHELRTPLNSILGWARMLRTGALGEAAAARAIETIERNAEAQARLIEDLLDVSRIISGNLRLDLRPIDLAPLIDAALDAVRPAAEAKSVRLECALDCGTGPVPGDPDRLRQVIVNLVSNAVKFTPEGGRVEVQLTCDGASAEVVVQDTGQGIEAEFLPHIFEPFRQAEGAGTTRRYSGLGLGLAIVRQLVELHGGSVRAESDGSGKGATFVLRLPLALTAEARGVAANSVARGGGTELEGAPSLEGVQVLVVDDNVDARIFAATVLEACGAEVVTVSSAADALEAVQRLKPHVLVSDLAMPGEDGFTLIEKVRALGTWQGGRTPAIALTARAAAVDRKRALLAGYQTYLVKPVDPAELAATTGSLALGRGDERPDSV
jgi:PAS domain S-box-containing protein